MNYSLDINSLREGYLDGSLTPDRVISDVLGRIAETAESNAWIHVLSRDELSPYLRRLQTAEPHEFPLYGIPFAIKDNIDLAGIPTTAGCPEYAYVPGQSAAVVQRLIEAGAIPVGKTNLDQFATGLVGARSPHGPGRNTFDPAYVSGGSSSGSAIAVANGTVSFALGTDTAGSGRVPAAFNNLIGLKPTRGLLPTQGVVPACRSIDCVSVFTLTAGDADAVLQVAEGHDAADPFSRPRQSAPPLPVQSGFRFGVPQPDQLQFFGDAEYERLFHQAVARLEALGGTAVTVDLAPFLDAARLLYEGPWVAERYAAIREFIEREPEALFPITHRIIAAGAEPSAADAFAGQYRLAELKQQADRNWRDVDLILTPTAGTCYRIAAVEAEPLVLNANLGYYTNFMNLLDYAAVAVPGGFRADGLPFGVTLFAPAFSDRDLLRLADRMQRALAVPMGAAGHPLPAADSVLAAADGTTVQLAVCGAHLSGLSLNHQLTERGGVLVGARRTAPVYRLYALPGGPPRRPGLVRARKGASIGVEVWELPMARFGDFVAAVPAPLAIGTVELADGSTLLGFLCETWATADAVEITAFGGWREWLAARD